MTDAERQRRSRAHRRAAGMRQITIMLPAPVMASLDRLRERHGSYAAAIGMLLAPPVAPPPGPEYPRSMRKRH